MSEALPYRNRDGDGDGRGEDDEEEEIDESVSEVFRWQSTTYRTRAIRLSKMPCCSPLKLVTLCLNSLLNQALGSRRQILQ